MQTKLYPISYTNLRMLYELTLILQDIRGHGHIPHQNTLENKIHHTVCRMFRKDREYCKNRQKKKKPGLHISEIIKFDRCVKIFNVYIEDIQLFYVEMEWISQMTRNAYNFKLLQNKYNHSSCHMAGMQRTLLKNEKISSIYLK